MNRAEYDAVRAHGRIEARPQESLPWYMRPIQFLADGPCAVGTWIVVPHDIWPFVTGITYSETDSSGYFITRRSCYVDFDLLPGDDIRRVGGIKCPLYGWWQKRFVGDVNLSGRNPEYVSRH